MDIPTNKTTTARDLTVAICGNPNCGKTTIFNGITGLRQKVGNYPGVTVEKTSGTFMVGRHPAHRFTVIDIPGSYSLAAFSPDEYIASQALCGFIRHERCPDIIVCVIDATNLERGLYLLFQIMQVGHPVVVALNMVDLSDRLGIKIDNAKLSEALGGIPVVSVVGSKGHGIDELKASLVQMADHPVVSTLQVYDPRIEDVLKTLEGGSDIGCRCRAEYLRVLLDRDGPAEKTYLGDQEKGKREILEQCRGHLIEQFGSLSAAETVPLTERAARITELVTSYKGKPRPSLTEKMDRIVLHPIMGPVILLAVMVLVFQSIFSWAAPLMDLIDAAFGSLSNLVEGSMAAGPLRSLLVSGIIGGVGSVLIFLPQIIILFLFIAILEDSGYMPRAAFLVDRLFGWCGLSGKSFIPMLSSFACAIPGLMATRTIENRNLRILTIMVAPLMSCSARLPIYTIMIAAFIPHKTYLGLFNSQGLLLTLLYMLGVVVAVIISLILSRTMFRSNRGTFIMEMPSYKLPTPRSIGIRVINRVQSFVTRAGTVILAITIIIWALSYYPRSAEITADFDNRIASVQTTFAEQRAELESQTGPEAAESTPDFTSARMETLTQDYETELRRLEGERAGAYLSDSYFGRLGRLLAPMFAPLGWDWKITMATLASFPAREVIIATLGTIYNLGSDENDSATPLISRMRQARWDDGPRIGQPVFTPAVALSVMVFFALCAQCGATLVTIRQETGRGYYAAVAFLYMTILAYVAAMVAYQVFSRMGY